MCEKYQDKNLDKFCNKVIGTIAIIMTIWLMVVSETQKEQLVSISVEEFLTQQDYTHCGGIWK